MSSSMDKDVLEQIIAAANGKMTAKAKKPKEDDKPREVVKDAGKEATVTLDGAKTAKFSEVFGFMPKSGIDHPVPMFSPDDWPEQMRAHIPARIVGYVWPQEELEMFIVGLIHGDAIFLHGPKGSGKSSLPEQACAVINMPWVRVNCRQDMESSAIFGGYVVEHGKMVWRDGPGAEVFRYGGILQIDEISASPAGINMSLQWALEKPARLYLAEMNASSEEKTLKANKWTRTVATDNTELQGDTSGHYAGTQVQNEALADRFLTSIRLGYLTREHETSILSERVPNLATGVIKDMIELAHLVRTGYQEGVVQSTVSPRTLINWGEKIAYFKKVTLAFKVAFYNKLTDDDRKVVGEYFYKVFGEELK